MAKTSPTQRTLTYLRDLGWPLVQTVEKWIPRAKRHKDLFKFADILAVHSEWGHLYVQVTTADNILARLSKIRETSLDEAEEILLADGAIELHGWKYYKKKKYGRHWRPRIIKVTHDVLHDMSDEQWRMAGSRLASIYKNEIRLRAHCETEKYELIAWMSHFPPRILVDVDLTISGARAREERPFLTKREKQEMADLAVGRLSNVLAKHDALVMKQSSADSPHSLRYVIRPSHYKDVL